MTGDSPEPSQAQRLLRLLGYARPYLLLVAVTIVFSLLYAGGLTGRAYLAKPLFDDVLVPSLTAGELLDDVLGEAPPETVSPEVVEAQRSQLRAHVDENLALLIAAVVVLVLAMPLLRFVRDYSGEWVMTRIGVDMQIGLGEKLLRLPLSYHWRGNRGDAVARVTNDTLVANRAQALVFGEAVQDVAQVLLALSWMFFLSWPLALLALGVGPPVAATLAFFGRRIRRTSQRRQEQVSEVVQRLMQILSGIRVIKSFDAEETERGSYRFEAMRYFRRAMRVVSNRVMSRSSVELFSQAAFAIGLLAGVAALINQLWELTLGDLAAFTVVSAMLYRPAKNLTRLYNAIQDSLPAAGRVFALLDADEEPADPPDARDLERVEREIRFRDVHFNYGRQDVLNGLELTLRAGETLALVGRTGAGKTTVADLLLRFLSPERGALEIDGVDLRQIRRSSLRRLISVVSQDPFLFDATLLENIRYGCPDADEGRVREAARAANAHEFIERLPQGYDTPAGELGELLSGGQRQRITIARAILRDPQILIFDEATSALDAKAEQQVQQAIRNLMDRRTVLLIAHRLSSVQAADRIAVLEGGRISAVGTQAEVLRDSALYRELVELQLAPADEPAG